MEASDSRRKYSDLSITTTPEPLSGFVITMSSRFFSSSIAFKRVSGGLRPFWLMKSSATDRSFVTVSSFMSSFARWGSILQYAFSKVAMTSIEDTFWGSANFKPRQRNNFWKKDSRYEEMFMICSSISVSLYNNLAILRVWVSITSCWNFLRRVVIIRKMLI